MSSPPAVTQKTLIIDDTDPAIIYSPNWEKASTVGSNTNEYKSTFHSSQADGNWLNYTFFGTRISVYGTVNAPNRYGSPKAVFSVDDGPTQAFNSIGEVRVDRLSTANTSHTLFYRSPNLSMDKEHTLSIVTEATADPDARFYFDFLTVSTENVTASGNFIVEEFNDTTLEAPPVNEGSARFLFNGTSVTVYGTTPVTTGATNAAAIAFYVDSVLVGNFTGSSPSGSIKHIPFFQQKGLSSDQEHTIEFLSLNSNKWYLDYTVYGNVDNTVGNDGQESNHGGRDNKLNAGVIAGAVIGALVGILALIAIIFLSRRSRKVRHKVGLNILDPPKFETSEVVDAVIVPFTTLNPHNGIPANSEDQGGNTGHAGMILASKERRAGGRAVPMLDVASTSGYSGVLSPTRSTAASADTQTIVPLAAKQHQDQAPGQVLRRATHSQAVEDTPRRKTQFTRIHSSAPLPPRLSSPLPPMAEEDNGIRIPATSPPAYTRD
ncbi:hypothetical protein M408DRAFT_28648 [Serendipita vermifera MAFF 305830]|uniref:Uncharacterized protein n=1 Tax=Serendipita vermifera MAFF 305830 TaxID=933852 RepID=A0A0C3ACZ6_SERVB|nr:hypothetical protein M408DRAFT_28648 [Serendipita vermifera MAFF 305830]